MIGSLVVVAFASATWWSTRVTAGKIIIPYAAVSQPQFQVDLQCLLFPKPTALFIAFVSIKLFNGRLFKRWWVRLRPDVTELLKELHRLERIRPLPLQRTQPPEESAMEQVTMAPKSTVIERELGSDPTEPARTLSAQSYSGITHLGPLDGPRVGGVKRYDE